MKFAIRDDDLNFFTPPGLVEGWYGDIFTANIPVGFATVPFVLPFKKSLHPEGKKMELKEYPVRNNPDLIEYVKDNSLIEILLHGYNHEVSERKYEYGAKSENLHNLKQNTRKGMEELEEIFDQEISVFVPPHDVLSNTGVRAIESAGLNVLRGRGSKNFLMRKVYASGFIKMVGHKIVHPGHHPPYPYVLDFDKHKEAYCCRLRDDNLEQLKKDLRYVAKKEGIFVITAHIHNLNKESKYNLLEIIDRARDYGFSFCKPSELFN
jgi:peptidoglycan/xylan/chitin deacetylase (PgdA/CDA1 family)